MQKNFLLLFFALILLSGNAFGQLSEPSNENFIFEQQFTPDLKSVDPGLVSRHFLGADVATLYYIVQKTYVNHKKTDHTGVGTQSVVEKPAIYNAIQNLNKVIRKMIKRKEITKSEGVEIMTDCLEKAYSLYFTKSDRFEEEIAKVDSFDAYVDLFKRIKFND